MQILVIKDRPKLVLLIIAGTGKVWLTKTLQIQANQSFPKRSSVLLRKETKALILVLSSFPVLREQDGDCRKWGRGMALPPFTSPAPSCCCARAAQTEWRCLHPLSSAQASSHSPGMAGRYTGAGIKEILGANSSNSMETSCPAELLPQSLLEVHVLLDFTSKTSAQDSKNSLLNEKTTTWNYSKT